MLYSSRKVILNNALTWMLIVSLVKCKSISWSMVSNAALKSIYARKTLDLLSKADKMSFGTLSGDICVCWLCETRKIIFRHSIRKNPFINTFLFICEKNDKLETGLKFLNISGFAKVGWRDTGKSPCIIDALNISVITVRSSSRKYATTSYHYKIISRSTVPINVFII